MTRTSAAASSQRAWRRAMVALQAALVVAQSGCGSGNTGSLDLFSPARQQARPNETEDARVGAGGQPPDARVVPPGPGCPDGGCFPDECRGDVDCHSGSASRCEVVSSRCVECLTVSECAG